MTLGLATRASMLQMLVNKQFIIADLAQEAHRSEMDMDTENIRLVNITLKVKSKRICYSSLNNWQSKDLANFILVFTNLNFHRLIWIHVLFRATKIRNKYEREYGTKQIHKSKFDLNGSNKVHSQSLLKDLSLLSIPKKLEEGKILA